jgi:hypothetical protein
LFGSLLVVAMALVLVIASAMPRLRERLLRAQST